ncbi:MAG: hypothetical protein GY799_30330 [Desulfobulbaceae bacterium]|nr:hypothetical protein [Desulfobulbaceae bacterium]
MFLTIPVVAGSTVTAAAITEIVAVCGAVAASYYVGACIGSVIVAAYETLDVIELTKVASWLNDIADKLGESVDKFLDMVVSNNGKASPIRTSAVLARKFA